MTDNKCETCPRRDSAALLLSLAELHRSLGSEAAARACELRAQAIESSSCPWWWGVKEENQNTGQIRHTFVCGAQAMVQFNLDQGARIEEALQTAQSCRNEIEKGFASRGPDYPNLPPASLLKALVTGE